MRIYLNDEVERKFRVKVAELGGKRGDLSRYFEEAILEWVERRKDEGKIG
jgi:hypothetical protein